MCNEFCIGQFMRIGPLLRWGSGRSVMELRQSERRSRRERSGRRVAVRRRSSWIRSHGQMLIGLPGVLVLCLLVVGCARSPVPVQVVHEDDRLLVRIERVAQDGTYSHPLALKADEVAMVLKGLSVREQPGAWPLRLFGKASGPERLFREDDVQVVAASLAEGLRAAKPGERVAFALYSPGKNPQYERVVTSGWIAVRDPYLHVGVEYVRSLQPRSTSRSYYPFYQELPPAPPPYDVLFEPQQFWVTDQADGQSAVQFRDLLRAQPGGGG
jgi:hypothetical protein